MVEGTFDVARRWALATAAAACFAPTSATAELSMTSLTRMGAAPSPTQRGTIETSTSKPSVYSSESLIPLAGSPPIGRETTVREFLIAEIRSWRHLGADWDGEGAAAPASVALDKTATFVCDLSTSDPMPEPMLHADGAVGLYWNDDERYADIKFLGDGRVAYFIERGGSKHKGVVERDDITLHAVLDSILFAQPAQLSATAPASSPTANA